MVELRLQRREDHRLPEPLWRDLHFINHMHAHRQGAPLAKGAGEVSHKQDRKVEEAHGRVGRWLGVGDVSVSRWQTAGLAAVRLHYQPQLAVEMASGLLLFYLCFLLHALACSLSSCMSDLYRCHVCF